MAKQRPNNAFAFAVEVDRALFLQLALDDIPATVPEGGDGENVQVVKERSQTGVLSGRSVRGSSHHDAAKCLIGIEGVKFLSRTHSLGLGF